MQLCRAVALGIKEQLKLPGIKAHYLPVTAENRFDAVAKGRVDILCGATTVTLSRRANVDFSIPVFIDGASIMFRVDGPDSFGKISGQKIGVRKGTTTENALKGALGSAKLEATIVAVPS